MITIGYSTRYSKPLFKEYLQKTCMYKEVQIIEKVNNGEKSLSQVYNEILNESSHDIVVLCHDDIEFDTNKWGDKLLKIFDKNPDYGIIGVAGTTYLPKSGMWWEDMTKMFGIVNHKHEGKKFESKYSDSLNGKIKDVVIVDGLFIAINKNKIDSNFDETVEGFHMYDVTFSFKNYLSGVKVGVTTDIRLTHLSIGITNEKWNENRKIFSEKYSSSLPSKIKFDESEKLKVLIGCLFFNKFTGSEMYVYELAKNLVKLNCDVSIVAAETDGPLSRIAKNEGIKVFNIKEPPGFKVGDGKWMIATQNGMTPSVPNTYYSIKKVNFDIIHCQHTPITELLLKLYPNVDKISTIHSEVIELENPIKDNTIKKYIAIRPEIKTHLIEKFSINESNIDVVYNPVDENRFKNKNLKSQNYVLFVGSIDYLREKTIRDLIDYTKSENKELWLVGENKSTYLYDLLTNVHVKHFPPSVDVENYIHNCNETAGILLGRTTIEGWMCGKSGWIYDVDSNGNIKSKKLFEPPSDLEKFHSTNVSKKIKNLYIEILNL